jgi:hypothetical protein
MGHVRGYMSDTKEITMQDGAKVLEAVNKYEGSSIVAISDIFSLNDNLRDSNFFNIFNKSMQAKGMLNPILLSSEEGFKSNTHPFDRRPQPDDSGKMYRCMIGNNRFKYAVEHGYTHIEALVVDNLQELKRLHNETFLEPRKMQRN